MLEAVDRFPLSPGEMMQDRVGKWYVRCPNCGAVSNSNHVDRYFCCPECGTIDEIAGTPCKEESK
jgi:ribosomal protein S27AE